MKNKLLILIFFPIVQFSFAQTKDTIFLQKKLVDAANNIYSTIYIDSGLIDFDKNHTYLLFEFDTLAYNENFKEIKVKKLVKVHNLKVPKKWIRLHEYKNEYFTYVPCEPGENYSIQLTDSCKVLYGMENAIAAAYTKIIKNNTQEFVFKVKDYLDEDSVSIKIVDSKKGMAVLTNYHIVKGKVYISRRLLVDADKAYKFRSIVHNCYNKENEFDGFTVPDYEKLLKTSTK